MNQPYREEKKLLRIPYLIFTSNDKKKNLEFWSWGKLSLFYGCLIFSIAFVLFFE
jgi:hypothetical protein